VEAALFPITHVWIKTAPVSHIRDGPIGIAYAMKKKSTTGKTLGRPREFIRSEAISEAMKLFWDHGYEGAAFGDLLGAMGLSPSSFYGAFGSKQELYFEAVRFYLSGPGNFVARALKEQKSARAAVASICEDAAVACTTKEFPCGSMVALAATHIGPAYSAVREAMADARKTIEKAMADRFRNAISTGELAPGTDVDVLAAYFAAVMRGMAVQARDGASRETLQMIGRAAMGLWPEDGQPQLKS
jgi:AcrR family transcriptional regulator